MKKLIKRLNIRHIKGNKMKRLVISSLIATAIFFADSTMYAQNISDEILIP